MNTHAKFIIDHPNLNTQFIMQEAAKAGTAPNNDSWEQWFGRVRKS